MTEENLREIDVERIFDKLREEIRKRKAGDGDGLDWYPEGEVSVTVEEMSGLNRFRQRRRQMFRNDLLPKFLSWRDIC